ncbi:TonB-dependent receptor domain-containing protein [Novosphingobium rhizosphaerae]|uniref:TonB-dependent receptor domain-containing protein n=1 Tax=Novosphingobium rhizosphaerae TaxID=1551649 RepID=UPI003D8196CA
MEPVQLFAEFEFHPIEALAITPGVKYVHFNRAISGPVNQKSRTPIDTEATWTKTLPFATINWQATSNWRSTANMPRACTSRPVQLLHQQRHGQRPGGAAAEPFKAATADLHQLSGGTVWHGSHVSVDVDGYIIDVNNKIASDTSTGAPANALVNIGQVRYKGVEGQVSLMPLRG